MIEKTLMEMISEVAKPLYDDLLATLPEAAEEMTFAEFCDDIRLTVQSQMGLNLI
jgi:hypothetical protein